MAIWKRLPKSSSNTAGSPANRWAIFGIGLEATGVLARLVEQAADVRHFVGRDVEDPLEGGDLVAADVAVGLGHLGAEYDDGDGEGKPTILGRRRATGPHEVHRVPGGGAQQRPQRPAQGEPRHAANDLAPYAHVR